MTTNLLHLASKVEGLEGPDREADELIADALFERSHFAQLADAPLGTGVMMWWQNGQQSSALRYTASLDAALTLALEGWAVEMRSRWGGSVWSVNLSRINEEKSGEDWVHATAKTPPLAFTAASLRARAQET